MALLTWAHSLRQLVFPLGLFPSITCLPSYLVKIYMMVENENWMIELEEILFYMLQKNKLGRLKRTCQIKFT